MALPYLYNGVSFMLAGVILIPFIPRGIHIPKAQWGWMLVAGVVLCIATALQQVGLLFTKVANASFLTSLYAVFTPFLLWIGFRERPHWIDLIAVSMAGIGAFMLSPGGQFQVQAGDSIELTGSLFWALHFVVLGKYATKFESISFASGHFIIRDHACLVLNKPAGIVVHPSPGHWSNTLLNALLDHCARGGAVGTPGVVHRLDKDTSGVMVVVKTEEAHRKLSVQFERHSITRHYEAFVVGVPAKSEGRIEAELGPDRHHPKRTSTQTPQPKRAVTDYRVEEAFGEAAGRIVLSPHTGRTHQIRAHLQSINHPILGDQVYGGERVGAIAGYEIPRVMLHARRLGFTHPVTGMYGEWPAAPRLDFDRARGVLCAGRLE